MSAYTLLLLCPRIRVLLLFILIGIALVQANKQHRCGSQM